MTGIGLPGALSPPPSWPVIEVPAPPLPSKLARAGQITVGALGSAGFSARYWRDEFNAAARDKALELDADAYQANDWSTLPIAATAAEQVGAPYLCDCHEWSLQVRWSMPLRRTAERRYVDTAQRLHLGSAAAVTTISGGMARLLREAYRLAETPTVIRSVPNYEDIALRAPADEIEVLYHGILGPTRQLETLVRSVERWRPGFRLVIRGATAPESDYVARLRALADQPELVGRVRIDPAVPMLDLVRHASASDIGVLLLRDDGPQQRYALPNKIFEYMMAGLALCTSATPECAAVIEERGVGITIPDANEESVAVAVNSLDVHSLLQYKQRSLIAAQELCWEREQAKLLDIYERVLG